MKFIKYLFVAFSFFLLFCRLADAQTVVANPVTAYSTDNFTYDGQSSPNYGIKWPLDSWNTGGYTSWLSGYSGIKLFTGGTPRISITGTGNIGIGTTTPQTILDVIGTIKGNVIRVAEGSGNIGFLGRAASITGGWSSTPEVLALTYFQRDFVIGGWRKSDGAWAGASLYINSDNGNVGIGNTAPAATLHIGKRESTTNYGSIDRMVIQPYFHTGGPWIITSRDDMYNANIDLKYNNTPLFTFNHSGCLLIGKTSHTNASYKLDVGGSIRADKVVVNSTGADFVFDSSYQMPSLKEVENFIATNKHLPGIASAAQMQQEGLEVGEHQTKLLQKTEELTLYIIDQDKKISSLEKKLSEQSLIIEKLLKQLTSTNSNQP